MAARYLYPAGGTRARGASEPRGRNARPGARERNTGRAGKELEMADLIVGKCCRAMPVAEKCGDGVIFLRCPICGRRSKNISVHYDGGHYIIQDLAGAKAAVDGWNNGEEVEHEQGKGYSSSADGSWGL